MLSRQRICILPSEEFIQTVGIVHVVRFTSVDFSDNIAYCISERYQGIIFYAQTTFALTLRLAYNARI